MRGQVLLREGYATGADCGREILDFVPPELHGRVIDQISSGSREQAELEVRNAGGTPVPVELRGRRINYRGIDAWASVWCNISERKLAEKTLEECEKKYRTMFNVEINPLLLIEQKNLIVLDANDAACRTYGYFRNELVGRNILDLFVEADRARTDAMKMKPGVHYYHHRRKEGADFPVEVSTAFFVHENQPVFIVSVHDLTQSRQVADALKLANIKHNLLLGMTRHDSHNNLSALRGYNVLLQGKQQIRSQGTVLRNRRR